MIDKTLFRILVLAGLASALAMIWIEMSGYGVLQVIPAERAGYSDETVRSMMIGGTIFAALLYGLMFFLWRPAKYLFLLWAAWWIAGPFVGFTVFIHLDGGLLAKEAIVPPLEIAVINLAAALTGILVTLSFTTKVFDE